MITSILSSADLHYYLAAGLSDLQSKILTNWIGPLFILGVAVFALVFIKDRAWMKLIAFVGIAAVVGTLIFAGSELFGSKDKGLTKVAKDAANQVNVVSPDYLLNDVLVK